MHDSVADGPVSEMALGVHATWPTAKELPTDSLRHRFPDRDFTVAWEIPGTVVGIQEDLLLAIDADFPWSLPRVVLKNTPALCQFPHIEKDGVFCLTPITAAAALPVGIGHAEQLIVEACKVFRDGVSGVNRDDFLREFSTYWTLGEKQTGRVELCLSNRSTTQVVHVAISQNMRYAAQTPEIARTWLTNRNLQVEAMEQGLYVRLPEPLYPNAFPKTSIDLIDLLQSVAPEAVELLAKQVKPGHRLTVILAFSFEGKTIAGAACIDVRNRVGDRQGRTVAFEPGRRSNTPSSRLNRLRTLSLPVNRYAVIRADMEYLVARTTGAISNAVRAIHVGVIGCGALGAVVATQLAQAGVSRLTLFDGDVLGIENTGRHILGSQYVGQNKAIALARDLQGRFCDATIKPIAKTWREAFMADPTTIENCDVLVCATGDWLSDAHLNHIAQRELEIPVVYTWLERFALAGHAILVPPGLACLRCLKNEYGEFAHQVSILGGDLPMDPACGAHYQPFSAFASAQTASMTTKLVLDAVEGRVQSTHLRTWVSAYEDFERVDAHIAPIWHDTLLVNSRFERIHRRDVPPADQCPQSPHSPLN
jgi:sulfur-carrier protein adenylyltransferase/sulfurtransferase